MTPDLEALLQDGHVTRLPRALSDAFDAYIDTLPWGGSRIDFQRLGPVEQLDLDDASDEDVAAWLARTHLSRHSHLAIWFNRKEGGIVAKLPEAIRQIDALEASPEAMYSFALDLRDGELVPTFEDLVEYRYGTFIALSVQPQWHRGDGSAVTARVHWAEVPPSGAEYVGVTRFDDPRTGLAAAWFQLVLRFLDSREAVEVRVLPPEEPRYIPAPEVPRHVLEPGFAFELCHGQRKVADVVIDGDPVERTVTSWVWVFMTDKAKGPRGIFTDIGPAHTWVRENRLTGTLIRYPMDTAMPPFPTVTQESYEYQDGVCFNLG